MQKVNRMRHALVILAAVFVLSNSSLAQSSAPHISGTVSDSAGHPIAFARVYLIGGQDTVQTDPRGRFRLDILQPTTVSVRAEFIGYIPRQHDSVVVRPGKSVWVEFRLPPQPVPENIDVFRAAPLPDST
jgi:Carboxypeptidase regulatory-like domain